VIALLTLLFQKKLSQPDCNGLGRICGMRYQILFNEIQFVGGKVAADIFFASVFIAVEKAPPLQGSVLCRRKRGSFTPGPVACTALADENVLPIGMRAGYGQYQ
jgi:hypothetical protein